MMRLRRIEATRFGRLADAGLGPLGDGLTVVSGPNEAGKSTYTALVRYLLYGFPTEKSSSDAPFLSDAGTREGRLVFESPEGEWVIERTAGPRGGPVGVRTLRGPECPNLVAELTSGVSEQAFRVVFGFGLAEMAAIERLRGTDDDIIARLYAAGAGLGVSPQEVRAAIEGEAAQLYRPRGSKPLINASIAEAREIRKKISELEQQAEQVAEARISLAELTRELEAARVRRDETASEHRTLHEQAQALDELEKTISSAEEELLTLRRNARDSFEALDALVVDEATLEASAEIEALGDELALFRKSLETVREHESHVASLARDAASRLAEAGLEADEAAAVDASPQTREVLEVWRERLLTAEERARSTSERRDREADEATVAQGAAVPAVAAAGGVSQRDFVPWVALAAGVLAVAGGILAGQWAASVTGAVLIALAAWLLLRAKTAAVSTDTDVRRLSESAAELARRAEQARLEAARAEQQLADMQAEWQAWLGERGLGFATEPSATLRVLDLVEEFRRIETERSKFEDRLKRERDSIDSYSDRVNELARRLGSEPAESTEEVPAVVGRLRERLAEAREAARAAERAADEARSAESRVADAEGREAKARERAREIMERLGVAGGLAELRAMVERAENEAVEAQERWGLLGSEYARLETTVGEREREDSMGSLRLELSSLNERIAEQAERYSVLSLAGRLLERAQERYERERQPEVVQEAERLFAMITRGGYPRLSVPLGASAIEVFDTSARAKDTALLSTGTAEQLYLALRLALIGQLGETGAGLPVLMDDVFANFDPGRKAGAAQAVAELARKRQVVVFTCHPETEAALKDAEPALSTLSLDRC